MLSDEALDRMLRDSDPDPGERATDPDSPVATRILARVRQSTRRRRRRLLVMVPTVALVVTGATAGTYAWVAGDGRGHTLDSTGLSCVSSADGDAVLNFDPGTDDPVDTCRERWRESFGQAAPTELTACVDSSQQGSITVYPGGRDQCGSHRSDPYLGPTEEQLALSRFRADLKKQFPDRTCIPHPEFRKVIDRLLDRHGLTGWTARHFQTADREPEGACADVSHYDETDRIIWLGDHRSGTPLTWP
ncbi:hypothetical protein [Streptomyces aurantiacus]|uniref:hypothetical protein n=1 Tax=Streptomyces aurantiacus TaxID=47760 RepID=UPI0006E3B0D2|nr:hypothetical protein [Streptomyces aurantiacus]